MRPRSVLLGAALVTACVSPALAQGQDGHYLDAQNEYFVAGEDYTSGYLNVTLARMLQPASDATRGEAQFLAIGPGPGHQAGERFWSRWFWRTRIAAPSEIAVGKLVFCADLTNNAGAYRPPSTRTEAIQSQWWMATITDIGDMYKQEALAGDYRLNINCVRVAQ